MSYHPTTGGAGYLLHTGGSGETYYFAVHENSNRPSAPISYAYRGSDNQIVARGSSDTALSIVQSHDPA